MKKHDWQDLSDHFLDFAQKCRCRSALLPFSHMNDMISFSEDKRGKVTKNI
jgi:hypothetical protein